MIRSVVVVIRRSGHIIHVLVICHSGKVEAEIFLELGHPVEAHYRKNGEKTKEGQFHVINADSNFAYQALKSLATH